MNNKKLSLNFESALEIRNFIHDNESGIYTGDNIDGQFTVIMLEKDKGMSVKRKQDNGWWIVHDYNEVGEFEGETYEK